MAFVRTCHKKLFEGIIRNPERLGNLWHGPIKIVGARIKPSEYIITVCVALWLGYVEFVYDRDSVREVTARSHVLFKSIYPFSDGNGRIGREEFSKAGIC